LPDETVSRRHCEISSQAHQYFVRDLGSSSGTFVAGFSVGGEPVSLPVGAHLQVGSCVLSLREASGIKVHVPPLSPEEFADFERASLGELPAGHKIRVESAG
jgi:pSer/pThr/pTyr-binding forkhead associated (FHA) protein